MESKKAYCLNGLTITVAITDLYYEDAVRLNVDMLAISTEVFAKSRIEIMTQTEFNHYETTLKEVHESITRSGHTKGFDPFFKWQQTKWTEAYLLSRGFRSVRTSQLLAVANGMGKYAIKYVYWRDGNTDAATMTTFGKYAERSVNVAGQYDVHQRGNKTMHGMMLMYGSHDVYGPSVGKGKTEPRVYNPKGREDLHMYQLMSAHVDNLTSWERKNMSSYAEVRDQIADRHDPDKLHRMTDNSSAFSMSLTTGFVVDPHNDSGAACELIQFVNTCGALPSGHKWQFAIGGAILELPDQVGETVIIGLKGEGVYHGTLPTSSTTDTIVHGNMGSALVTKGKIIEGFRRQVSRGEKTSIGLCASTLYTPKYHCVYNCGFRGPMTREGYDFVLAHECQCRKRKYGAVFESIERPV